MAYYQLAKSKTFSKNWVNTLNCLKIQQKNCFSPQNSNLYAYAANNPVRYIAPDGNKINKLTDEQWTIVKTNLYNLSSNLETIINELDNCNNDISNLNQDILNSAKKYLSSQFGKLPLDINVLKTQLVQQKEHIDSLTRDDFKYDDKTGAFAYTYPFFDDIFLGDLFFDAKDSGGFDTKEGTILHESTHFMWILGTTDLTYIKNEMEKLPDEGIRKYKSNNANNWEYFYESLVE